MADLAVARAPGASLRAGLYESHFMCAWDPAGGRAAWIRYTSLKRPGQPARPSVWLTWFSSRSSAPVALRVTSEEPVAPPPGPLWCSSPLGAIGPGVVQGALRRGAVQGASDAGAVQGASDAGAVQGAIDEASWDLTWSARAGSVPYLPARWLYDRPLPRSNGLSLAPSAVVSGSLRIDGAAVDLSGWDATIGHNWGSDHAEQWSWIHAGGLGADGSGWLDLALARVRIGPLLTPWIAAGAVSLDGLVYTPARRSRVRRSLNGPATSLSLALVGGGAGVGVSTGAGSLSLEIDAPVASTVSWHYAAPTGPGRAVTHCSIADAVITLGAASFEVHGRLAVEHGAPAT